MNLIIPIAVGGALGSISRHYILLISARFSGEIFPYGTLIVNVMGSFIIGALMEMLALKWQWPLEWRAFIFTGFLGGFTTFSAFSMDAFRLFETGNWMSAFLYAAVSVILSLAAVFFASYVVRGAFA